MSLIFMQYYYTLYNFIQEKIMEQSKLIQKIRKNNLKKIIKNDFGDKIDVFADKIGKNKFVVYAMLWPIENLNHRKISDATSRAIEQKLGLELFSLDAEQDQYVDDPNYIIIPFMDIKSSNEYGDIFLHSTERIKLPKAMFDNISSIGDLIAYKICDMEMYPLYGIGDIVIVNRLKSEIEDGHQYLIQHKGKFIIRTLTSIEDVVLIESSRVSVQIKKQSSEITIAGIIDTEIRKKLYVS